MLKNNNQEDRHYLESYLDLLSLLGMKFTDKDKYVEKHLTVEEMIETRQLLKNNKITEKDLLVSFQAGAKWENKRWSYKNFGKLAKKLIEHNKHIKVILLGSPEEFELNEKIKAYSPNIINLSGKISLTGVAGVLKLSKLAVGNDSGLMHLAGAVNIPNIVLSGVGNPHHSRVLSKTSKKSIVIHKNNFCKPCMTDNKDCKLKYKCMKVIKVDDVIYEIKRGNSQWNLKLF